MAAALVIIPCLALLSLVLWSLAGFLRDFRRNVRCVAQFPPPAKPPHWLTGHLNLYKPDEQSLLEINKFLSTNGYKCTAGWMGPVVALSACHPDAVKPMLKEPKLRHVYNLLDPWLGKGLLTVEDGPKWHRNRHLLTPAFHYSILKGYVSVYNACLQQFFRKWDTSAKLNEPVLVFDTVSTLSLDIILQCSFGFKSNCQQEGNRPAYIKGVYQLSESIAERFFNPFYQLDWLFFLTPAGRRMKRACKVVHTHAEMIIKERRKALGLEGGYNKELTSGSESQDLLDHITKSRHLDFLDILLTAVGEDGVGLTDTEIRNEVDTFMFEGHDTTTSGMSWTLYCLAKHPEHQEKVRKEVRRVLNGRETLEYEDLKELKYTQWCIKEAMRLYPPVILIFREASREIEINGIKIPKGVWLSIITYFLHHNPKIWPDPEKFDPLRFDPSNAEGRDPYAYLAFSAGSRNCIGQNFAINEEKVVVASIVNRYRLSVVKDHVVEMLPVIVLRAKYDIKLHLERLLD